MSDAGHVHESVRDYYGRVLENTKDLKTDACCGTVNMPPHLRRLTAELPDEILTRFYGCGSPIPSALDGATVLDLGCGTGRDAYLCAALTGEQGTVIGLDMTPAQLEIARRHEEALAAQYGYARKNTRFVEGYLEDLAAAGIEDESVDVVISNCVINLAPDKRRVFEEILRVLKPGGELLFADVFADRRLPAAVWNDPVLVGECLAGALYVEDFRRLLAGLGVPDYRVVASSPIAIEDPATALKTQMANFVSLTVRAFKLDSLEDRCEYFGQQATYRGSIPHEPDRFVLDSGHEFPTGEHVPVCGNTVSILTETRLAPHFQILGEQQVHFGLFPSGAKCAPSDGGAVSGGCC